MCEEIERQYAPREVQTCILSMITIAAHALSNYTPEMRQELLVVMDAIVDVLHGEHEDYTEYLNR